MLRTGMLSVELFRGECETQSYSSQHEKTAEISARR